MLQSPPKYSFSIENDISATVLCCTRQQFNFVERFSNLIKRISDEPESETFVFFSIITDATRSIKRMIPVSMTLGIDRNEGAGAF